MKATHHSNLVSIIGAAYLQPIAELLDTLFSKPSRKSINQVQTSESENGYSTAICLLMVACFESYSMRARYLNRNTPIANDPANRHALKFLHALYPTFRCFTALTEVYVLRDCIIHNHLWEIDYYWNDLTPMALTSAKKAPFSGDKKRYPQCVDGRTRRTINLKLHVVPIRVDRTDVLKVLDTVWQGLQFLEQQNLNQCQVSEWTVGFRGKHVFFVDLIRRMKRQQTK